MKKKNIFIGLALSLAVTGCGKEALENTNNNVKEEVKQEENEEVKEAKTETVSYTHLTLPTICSV